MRDEENRQALLRCDFGQQGLQVQAGDGVERAERLIKQQKRFACLQRPHKRRTLPLPAGAFVWAAIQQVAQPARSNVADGGFQRCLPPRAMKCFGEDDVIRNRPPRQEQIFLQHVAGQTGAQEHGFALQPNVAAIRLHQPGDEVEEGGFSAAAGPQDGEKLPLLQGKRDILNGGDGGFIGGEVFGEVCNLEIRCRHGVTPFLAGGNAPALQ